MPAEIDFEADDRPLVDVLFGHNKFTIPRYQRPYSWTLDHVSEFWADLVASAKPFFIGSFILNQEKLEETGYLDIVDGQQRVLTIMILLAAMRDVSRDIDAKLSDLIQEKDISIDQRDGTLEKRVVCGDSTREYFEKYIQSYPHEDIANSPVLTKEERLIRSNYEYFIAMLLEDTNKLGSKSEKSNRLKTLRTRIENLVVIQFLISNEEDAYEIFETTNARGVDLNVADLVKNLVLKNLKIKNNKDKAKEIWQEIEANIQSTGTEVKKFLRYFWISKYGFVTEKKLFKAIKNEIVDWDSFLEELARASEDYYLLLQGTEAEWQAWDKTIYSKVYKSVSGIGLMNVSQCYVFFLSLLRNRKLIGTNPTRVFQLTEKFTFAYSAVCKLPGNRVERMYSRYALRLEQIATGEAANKVSAKTQSLFHEYEKELKEERPAFDYFIEQFKDIRYKTSDEGRLFVKYILSRVNEIFEKTKEYKVDFANVNIEHFLPQKPDKGWALTQAAIKDYVNLLGNLTILDKTINSVAGNKVVQEKTREIGKSRLPINKVFVKLIKAQGYRWDESLIRQRQDELAKLAYKKVWMF